MPFGVHALAIKLNQNEIKKVVAVSEKGANELAVNVDLEAKTTVISADKGIAAESYFDASAGNCIEKNLLCKNNEMMVGIFGTKTMSPTPRLSDIEIICADYGFIYMRPSQVALGNVATSKLYTYACPSGHVMLGFDGWLKQYISNLELQCAELFQPIQDALDRLKTREPRLKQVLP